MFKSIWYKIRTFPYNLIRLQLSAYSDIAVLFVLFPGCSFWKDFDNATFYNGKNLHHDRLNDAIFTYFSSFYILGCHWVWTCSNISVGTFEKRRIKRPWNLHGYSLHRHLQMCWPQDCFVWCATTGGEYWHSLSYIYFYLIIWNF